MAQAAVRTRSRFAPAVDPNVIPFIDVLLVLLIIFMVTAPKPTTDLRVDLPTPGAAAPVAIPPTTIQLESYGSSYRVRVGAVYAPLDELGQVTLASVLAANPSLSTGQALSEARIFVRSDLDVAYQNVVSVLEALNAARFQNVAIVAPPGAA